MPDMKDLYAQVDAALDDILALEQALVRIPSVNTGFMPTGNETAVAEYARDWLAEDEALPGDYLALRLGFDNGTTVAREWLAEDGIESEILGRDPDRGN